MSKYNIRAHHGLCIAFFEGKGYSSDFTKNMRDIISALDENPYITITSDLDVICVKCPNNQNSKCECAPKVSQYDQAVLTQCHIKSGDSMPWMDFKNVIYTQIINANKMRTICTDCQWSSICFKKQ